MSILIIGLSLSFLLFLLAAGLTLIFGMLGVTVFGLVFTPVFYVLVRWIAGLRGPKPAEGATHQP